MEEARDPLKSKVEALLFAAPEPLKINDVARLLEQPRPAIKKALDQLMAEFSARDGALAVARQGPGYAIVLKGDYQDVASLLMPPDIEQAELKTLSVIAINQPLTQSRLVELRGSTAYEHVKTLVEKGLIKRRRDGSTFIVRTTRLFSTRFRLEDDPERIRDAMLALERRTDAGERISSLEPGPAAAEAPMDSPESSEPLAAISSEPLELNSVALSNEPAVSEAAPRPAATASETALAVEPEPAPEPSISRPE